MCGLGRGLPWTLSLPTLVCALGLPRSLSGFVSLGSKNPAPTHANGVIGLLSGLAPLGAGAEESTGGRS